MRSASAVGITAPTWAAFRITRRSARAAPRTSTDPGRCVAMPRAAKANWTRWLLLSAAVVAADLATKGWIGHAFAPGEVHPVTPFFNLVLVYNTGAAFSFLAGAGGWQRWFFM